MLGEQLGWQDPVTVERLNASPGRAAAADLPAPARAAIVDHNALDIELYEFALDLFERRLSSAAAARATAPLPGHAAG